MSKREPIDLKRAIEHWVGTVKQYGMPTDSGWKVGGVFCYGKIRAAGAQLENAMAVSLLAKLEGGPIPAGEVVQNPNVIAANELLMTALGSNPGRDKRLASDSAQERFPFNDVITHTMIAAAEQALDLLRCNKTYRPTEVFERLITPAYVKHHRALIALKVEFESLTGRKMPDEDDDVEWTTLAAEYGYPHTKGTAYSIACYIVGRCRAKADGAEWHVVTKTPLLTETEQNIIEALRNKRMTGGELAKAAGYPFNSNFKNTLSSLRKRGILVNRSDTQGRGYEVADKGQDKRQD